MAIGRPISLTPNVATKAISAIATANQTEFTVTGGYRINEISVYRNGVRLSEDRDFTASDGDTVTLTSAATVDDLIEFQVFDSFNVSSAIVSAASSQTLNGNLNVTGTLYGGGLLLSGSTNLNVGILTASTALHVGSALTSNAAGDLETIGIITAASFGAVSGSTGTFSGAVNVDATTDSTSSSTGALIVDGGLGVAKNVYIGAGLSVAGTLTYEDVTSVDSVGLITAKSGVNVTGGQIQVGAAFSVGPAGVVTAASYYGDGSNLSNITTTTINSNADNRLITGSGTANTLNGETNLTFDGASFKVGSGITMAATSGVVTFANGSATANNITLGNGKLRLYHNGSNAGYISMDTAEAGTLYIQGTGNTNGNIQIYNNYIAMASGGNQKLLVQSQGVDIQNGYFKAGVTTATSLTVTGTAGLTASGGEFKVGTALTVASTSGVATFGQDVTFLGADGYHMSWDQSTNQLRFPDYAKVAFGDPSGNGDTRMYQNGTTFYLYAESGTENILIGGNGPVSLRYDGSTKLATTNDGVNITGIVTSTGGFSAGDDDELKLGNDGDLSIKFTGSNSIIDHTPGGGTIYIRGDALALQSSQATAENYLVANANGAVELYYNNTKTAYTDSNGLVLKAADGQPAYLYFHADNADDNADKWVHAAETDGTYALKSYSTGSWVAGLQVDGSGNVSDIKGNVRDIIYQNKTSGYTLVATDAGKAIHISTGGVTINNSIFSAGNAVSIINNSGSDQTITQGSGVTLYNTSDGSTGNKTLSGRGMATVWFSSASVGYISGNI